MRRAHVVVLCSLAWTGHAIAAGATADEAQQLVDTFHHYLGMPKAADYVRSEPQGDAYRLSFDIAGFARPFESNVFTLDASELTFLAKPLANGTWQVSDLQMDPLTIHVGEVTTTYRWGGVTFDGIYDPALAAFTKFDETVNEVSTETTGPNVNSATHYGMQTVRGTGAAAGSGAVDATVEQTMSDLSAHETVASPQSPTSPPVDIAYSVDSGSGAVTIAALEARKVLDLWAYAVAHLQKDAPDVDEKELKAQLIALLPLFQHLDEKGMIQGVRVETPLGEFGVQEFGGSLAMSGLSSNSEMAVTINVSGPAYPEELTPPWAKQLVPTGLALGFAVSGLDLDASVRKLIESFHLNRTPMIDQAEARAAGQLALPAGGVAVKLQSTHIDGPLLHVQVEGEMRLTMPAPTANFEVTATGLDSAIELLKGADDPVASQTLASLTLAQTLGRPGDNGSEHFSIEIGNGGSVTINGQMLRPPTNGTP